MDDWRSEIVAMLEGDLEAVNRFFAVWHPQFYRWAGGRPYSWRADPDDIAQETMIKLTRNHCRALVEWHGMNDDAANTTASLGAYLRRICENTALDLGRARGRDRGVPLDDEFLAGPGSDPLAVLEGETLRDMLAEAFTRLSTSDQEVLTLRFADGCSLREVAEQLGITPNNAGQRAHRAERRLHKQLANLARQGGER